MSVFVSKPTNLFNPNSRRRQRQTGIQRQHSFSLDIPQNIYDSDKLSRGLDSICFEQPLRSREEDRVFLYLPRNLSYCEVCSDVIRDHVQKKVRLLSNRLSQFDDVPPTPVEARATFDVGENSENEDTEKDNNFDVDNNCKSWCTKYPLPLLSSKRPILKRKTRAVSFPAPRREGKKIVRFADALGLELESVRLLVQKDLPKIVQSCSKLDQKAKPKITPKKIQLIPAFLPPSLSTAFLSRLKKLKVSLHSVSTADSTVYGIVSVVNVTFHKTVFIRYTANGWLSCHDEIATYVDGSSVDDTDKFSFTLFCNPSDLCTTGHSLFFAICYETASGTRYWDNNEGKNYCIKCEKRDVPVVGNHSWVHFL